MVCINSFPKKCFSKLKVVALINYCKLTIKMRFDIKLSNCTKLETEVDLYELTTVFHNILAVSDFALAIALNYAVIIQVKNGH